jgi:DNA polymerase I
MRCVTASLEALEAWIAEAREAGTVAIDTETTSLDCMTCDLVGVSLALRPGRACYIPLGIAAGLDLSTRRGWCPARSRWRGAARLKPLFEAPGVLKIGHNLKYDWLVLARTASRPRPSTTPC